MAPKDTDTKAVPVTAEADKKKDEDDAKNTKKNNKGANSSDDLIQEDTMSEEDRELKERLETCVSTVLNEASEASVTIPIRNNALDVIVNELRTATSSMTSVPKPLKFLRPHFAPIKTLYTTFQDADLEKDSLEFRARLADVLAVLAMTMGKPGEFFAIFLKSKHRRHLNFYAVPSFHLKLTHFLFLICSTYLLKTEERESLKFKLAGAKDYDSLASKGSPSKHAEDNLGSWGHEFVRSLAGEIGQEYNQRVIDGSDPDSDEPFADLLKMVHVIVPFHLTHNAEAEAIDLLIEVQRLKFLLELDSIHEDNYQRICLYLIKTASYMSDPDDLVVRLIQLKFSSVVVFCLTIHINFSHITFVLMSFFTSSAGNVRNCLRNLPQAKAVL